MTALDVLLAERHAGAWYRRRVNEHAAAKATTGEARAALAAVEASRHRANAHDRFVLERHARLVAAAAAGDTLDQAAADLWIEPDSLRSWLERHDRGLLDQLRTNHQPGREPHKRDPRPCPAVGVPA